MSTVFAYLHLQSELEENRINEIDSILRLFGATPLKNGRIVFSFTMPKILFESVFDTELTYDAELEIWLPEKSIKIPASLSHDVKAVVLPMPFTTS